MKTPNLSLPFLAAAQAQKHVTVNEALNALDAIVQLAVADRDLAAPPPSPSNGDRYIVAAGATGAWSGESDHIAAWQDGAWAFLIPQSGWLAWIADEGCLVTWNGATWADTVGDALNPTPLVGINTTADPTSRLAVAAAASLFTHDGAGHQIKINKAAPGDTASLLFQTGYSGRAEVATSGDDDLRIKVSADGSAWNDALVIDRTTGRPTFPKGAARTQLDIFTADGSWTRPEWAAWVEIVLIGGGGGGGSGRRGAAGTQRGGGGGGSGGAMVTGAFLASEMPASLDVEIGAGGSGGVAASSDDTDGSSGDSGGVTSVLDAGTVILAATGGAPGGGGSSTNGTAAAGVLGTNGLSNPGSTGAVSAAQATPAGALDGPGGGGGGGILTAANGVGNAGSGADGYRMGTPGREASGGIRPTAINSAGTPGIDKRWQRGTGGGGSGSKGSLTADGPPGGNGGAPGGGGGGGCGSLNGFASGAGGNGGRGEARIISIG